MDGFKKFLKSKMVKHQQMQKQRQKKLKAKVILREKLNKRKARWFGHPC